MAWEVEYACECGRRLDMNGLAPADGLVLVGRGWCWRCQRYVTKSDAIATSREVLNGSVQSSAKSAK